MKYVEFTKRLGAAQTKSASLAARPGAIEEEMVRLTARLAEANREVNLLIETLLLWS